jgi:hypothetical protein
VTEATEEIKTLLPPSCWEEKSEQEKVQHAYWSCYGFNTPKTPGSGTANLLTN